MRPSRRQFVQGSMAATLAAAFPTNIHASLATDGFIEFTAGPTKKKLFREDGTDSQLWTYNKSSPGPEIRVKRGERVKVRLINQLEEPTSIHWHGVRIANAMDGVSGLTQDGVLPGETFEYDFTVPDAGTYWYHAHNKSWNQVARGLYGALIVEEDEQVFDRDHDLTLVIDDWRLDREGALDIASMGSLMDWSHGGRLGNWLTVNGKPTPGFELRSGEAYRLRLINASNARTLEIDPNRFGALVLGYDGQPLKEPEKISGSRMLIGSGQRVDLLVIPKSGDNFSIEELSPDQPFAFANFTIIEGADNGSADIRLVSNNIPDPDYANTRDFRLHMIGGAMSNGGEIVYKGKKLQGEDFRTTRQVWAFNGVANLADEPFFSIARNETIIIETFNDTSFMHAMHLHGHHFRIIDSGDGVTNHNAPWMDTYMIKPAQTTRIAFVADNPGKWLLHCHMLEHAAAGMTTWINVA
ncbi:MAG: multicopper oxidase family protein [Rhizobiaceae bacterium]|nr:multicopper oxidase family protein [Rhizobiaceae bacterium]